MSSVEIILGGLVNKTSSSFNTHCAVDRYTISIIPITKTFYTTKLEPLDKNCFSFKNMNLNTSQNDALVGVMNEFETYFSNFKNCVYSKSSDYYKTLSKCFVTEVLTYELDFFKCFDIAYEIFEDNVFQCLQENILSNHIVLNLEDI